jgi:hypothetical protein
MLVPVLTLETDSQHITKEGAERTWHGMGKADQRGGSLGCEVEMFLDFLLMLASADQEGEFV